MAFATLFTTMFNNALLLLGEISRWSLDLPFSASRMSHYQHNINAPQFPGGVHMAHFSLANTTLIGQEVQQRLWEKYWGQQCPAVSTPLMWYHPGMCYHGYPYSVPTTFHAASTHNGFDQSQNPKLLQQNTIKSSNNGGEQSLKSHYEMSILAELLEEENIAKTSKQKQDISYSSPKVSSQILSTTCIFHIKISNSSWGNLVFNQDNIHDKLFFIQEVPPHEIPKHLIS